MLDDLRAALSTLEAVVRDFEPRLLDGHGAVRAVELFARVKHLGAAGAALAATRVDETHAYRERGARSAGHWLAAATGDTVASAFRALETADALAGLPATAQAFRAGRISEAQAHEITGAARKDPSAEAELVGAARGSTSMKGLKDRCRRVRAAAEVDDAAWAKRLHDGRSLRQWIDGDSAVCGAWRMSPDKGAEVKAALDAETDLIFREARAGGVRESREAYASDALHALVTRGPRRATSASLVCDEAPVQRGHALRGERCEIPGIGPIPVTIARAMLADAKVRAVPRDGELLPQYSSDGRYYPQWLKDWLDQRYPVCGQPGCDADFHLQYDHVVALEDGGRTEKDNLWRLCWHHHDLKTNRGWTVKGTPHRWELVPPDGRDPP